VVSRGFNREKPRGGCPGLLLGGGGGGGGGGWGVVWGVELREMNELFKKNLF